MTRPCHVRHLGLVDYEPTWHAMRAFTEHRTANTPDEIWLLEHPAVYTQGQAGKPEHILLQNHIPVVQTDRGGQVTYHAPGQLVGYLLIDIQRLGLAPREFVERIEDALASAVRSWGVDAVADRDAHGVYVHGAKIASLGLRIRRGASYHGFALNVSMDLMPWQAINPCGYPGLSMCRLQDFVPLTAEALMSQCQTRCLHALQQHLPELDLGLEKAL